MVDAGMHAGAWIVSALGEQHRGTRGHDVPPVLERRFEHEALPHRRVLYATACRLTRNPADAEDLVQETFLRAYRGFASYAPETNIRAWLFTILHRARTDHFRKASRSDEQLAYYVAQAREIIDLSIMSQRQIVDDLQQLPARQAAQPSEA